MKTTNALQVLALAICFATATEACAYFDPTIGRWASRDCIEERGGLNVYAFVRNNPIAHIDMNGCMDDELNWGEAGPPAPPKPGDPQGWNRVPTWFKNPKDEGKPCFTCNFPGRIKSARRIDPVPTASLTRSGAWTMHMQLDLQMVGAYKDLAVIWWTCERGDGTSGILPLCFNSLVCDFPSGVTTSRNGGPYLTQAKVRYLSCENSVWVKHIHNGGSGLSGAYTWESATWVFNPL